MVRQKIYVIIHGVMKAKWIDPKDIYDVPDVVFSMPTPPVEEAKPVEEEKKETEKSAEAKKPVATVEQPKRRGRPKRGKK